MMFFVSLRVSERDALISWSSASRPGEPAPGLKDEEDEVSELKIWVAGMLEGKIG